MIISWVQILFYALVLANIGIRIYNKKKKKKKFEKENVNKSIEVDYEEKN